MELIGISCQGPTFQMLVNRSWDGYTGQVTLKKSNVEPCVHLRSKCPMCCGQYSINAVYFDSGFK